MTAGVSAAKGRLELASTEPGGTKTHHGTHGIAAPGAARHVIIQTLGQDAEVLILRAR